MVLGYHRTLQATDLYKLDETRTAETLSRHFEAAWKKRMHDAKSYNDQLEKGEIEPGLLTKATWRARSCFMSKSSKESFMEKKRKDWITQQMRHASLAWALNDVFKRSFWLGGAYKARSSFSTRKST